MDTYGCSPYTCSGACGPKTGAAKWTLGGWEMTDILTVSSGDFLTPSYAAYDATGLNITSGRPDLIGDPSIGNPSRDLWFNPGAFAIPGAKPGTPLVAPTSPIGRFGNAGAGIFTGPRWWQNDYGVVLQFPIHERLRINFFSLRRMCSTHQQRQPEHHHHHHADGRQDPGHSRRRQNLRRRPRQIQLRLRLEF